jgi:transposase
MEIEGMRRTNDEEILRMLREGKQQKEIANHFGVTPSYICKRVRLLLPQDEPESFRNLTDKEKRFVLEKARGKTNLDAAMKSYDVTSRESAKVLGSNLMDKEEIRLAIDELMEQAGMGRRYRVQRLKTCVDHPDPNVTLKALDQSWRLDGSYAPEKVDMFSQSQNVIAILDATQKELQKSLEMLTEAQEDVTDAD